LSGEPIAGKVVGPSFGADEVPDVIEAVLETYREQRLSGETFIDAFRRLGMDAFKGSANGARHTAEVETV
jgi:sulfite reductase (NADPH) hemoprotein beta-component